MRARHSYFCPCPRGLEATLAEELGEIAQLAGPDAGLEVHNQVPGGVHCSGSIIGAYQLNLRSHIASRVLLRIAHGAYKNENDIYDLTLEQEWESWFKVSRTIRVDVTAVKSSLRSLEFVTLKIKDAICDRFRERFDERPSVNTKSPDMRIAGFLDTHNFTIYLDTSGEALFKRGWRGETGVAPLRENLAAGLLRSSGWKPGMALFDPMCGSGTILVEAAQMLAGIPPGTRRHFAFEKFDNFDAGIWLAIKGDVKPNPLPTVPTIFGSDISGDMVAIARRNLRAAGIQFEVPLKQIEAQEIRPPVDADGKPVTGIMLTNPPYGERISVRGDNALPTDELLLSFFSAFGTTLKQRFTNWSVFLFSADPSLPKLLRLKEARKTPLFNGALECRLFRFDMVAGFHRREAAKPRSDQT
ncbi:MAG: class I SAM-dependent RNA methyltransferase [Herbaspirillum sp.]